MIEKKYFLTVFVLLLLTGIALGHGLATYDIPGGVDEILSVHLSEGSGDWTILKNGDSWKKLDSWIFDFPRKYDSYGATIAAIKEEYQIIKVFKDAIDNEFFVCVTRRKSRGGGRKRTRGREVK